MNLRTYLRGLTTDHDRAQFARQVASTIGHLRNVANGYRSCAPRLAVAIEVMTAGSVRRYDLRPTDWHLIWPELIGTEGAPPVPADDVHRAAA